MRERRFPGCAKFNFPLPCVAGDVSRRGCCGCSKGEGERLDFREVLASLRDLRKNISEDVIQELGPSHETHGSRLPQTGLQIQCPHCGNWTNQPLVQACGECAIIACVGCVTEECLPSHYNTRPPTQTSDANPDSRGKEEFHIMVHAQSVAAVTMPVNPKMIISILLRNTGCLLR